MKNFTYLLIAVTAVLLSATSCEKKVYQYYYSFVTTHVPVGSSATFSFTTDAGKTFTVNNTSAFSSFKVREGVRAYILFAVPQGTVTTGSTTDITLYSIDTSFVRVPSVTIPKDDRLDSFGLDYITPDISDTYPAMTLANTYINCGFYCGDISKHKFTFVHEDSSYPDDIFRIYLCHDAGTDTATSVNWNWMYLPAGDFDFTGYATVRFIIKGHDNWYRLDYKLPSSADEISYPKVETFGSRDECK